MTAALLAQATDCDPCPAGGILGYVIFCLFLLAFVCIYGWVSSRYGERWENHKARQRMRKYTEAARKARSR
jgi:hypothetical protein